MRVLMIRSQSNPEIIDVNHDLLAFQHLVGGMIEVVEPFQDDDVVLVCNETGRCIGRPVNRVVNNNIDILKQKERKNKGLKGAKEEGSKGGENTEERGRRGPNGFIPFTTSAGDND